MAHTRRDVHPSFGYIALDLVACGNRLGDPPMRPAELMKVLRELRISFHSFDLSHAARQCCGMRYRHGALRSARPRTFDCSTLVQYIYAHAGVWLPRYTHLMVDHGDAVMPPYKPGDLLFTTGKGAWRHPAYPDRIGHVAFVTAEDACVHTDNAGTKRVIEMPILKLQWPIAVAKRLLPRTDACTVVLLPSHLLWVQSPAEVEAIVRSHLQMKHRPRSK
jgi:hypothetical protein